MLSMNLIYHSFCHILRRYAIPAVFACASLLPLPGCSSATQPVQTPGAETTWGLTPEATLIYAALLLDQSIRDEKSFGIFTAGELCLDIDPTSPTLTEAASWLMFNRELGAAKALLERAVDKAPDSLPLHILLAECCVEEGRLDLAVALLEQFLARRPDADEAKQELGLLLLRIQRWQDAADLFAGLPERLHSPHIRLAHAQALANLKRYPEALAQLKLLLKEQPDSLNASMAMVDVLEQSGKPSQARELCRKLVRQHPDNAGLRLRLIELELASNRPRSALRLCSVSEDSPAFVFAAMTRFLEHERYTEAETLINGLIQNENVPEEAWLYLAAIKYEAHKDLNGALEALSNILPDGLLADKAFLLKANILIKAGKEEDALATLQKGSVLYPEENIFPLMQLQIFHIQGRREEALKALDTYLHNNPEDVEVLFVKGTLLEELKRKGEALDLMERILVLDPLHYQAMNFLGYNLVENLPDTASPERRKATLDKALKLLHRAVELAPDSAHILDSLAWAQFKAGQLSEAWRNIQATVQMPGGDEEAEIWDHYGEIAKAMGLPGEARKAWQQAMTLTPDARARFQQKLDALRTH